MQPQSQPQPQPTLKQQHRAYILRVHKSIAGIHIPFDKVYLFHKDDKELLPSIFRNAMVFPLTTAFANMLNIVTYGTAQNNADMHYRDMHYSAFPAQRWEKRALTALTKENNPILLGQRKDYLALVPTFFSSNGVPSIHKGKKHLRKGKPSVFAAYLVAFKARSANGTSMMRRVVSVQSYFILNGKIARPICMMCPRHLYFLEGRCVVGDSDCYSYLAQAKRSDMVEGLQRYEELLKYNQEPQLDIEENECPATLKPELTV